MVIYFVFLFEKVFLAIRVPKVPVTYKNRIDSVSRFNVAL